MSDVSYFEDKNNIGNVGEVIVYPLWFIGTISTPIFHAPLLLISDGLFNPPRGGLPRMPTLIGNVDLAIIWSGIFYLVYLIRRRISKKMEQPAIS